MSEMEKQDILELPSKTSAQLNNTDGMLGFNEIDGGYQVTLENLMQYIAGDAKEFIPPTHGTAGQLLRSTGDGGSEWGDAASPEEIAEAVTDWLEENVPTGETLVVDESLTIEGAAADAKVTGEKIEAAEGAIEDLRKEMFSAPIEYSGITTDSSWTTGSGVDSQTGGNMSDSDYCRTGFIKIESTTYIHLDSETYDFNVWEYTSNSTSSAIFAPKKAYNDKDAFVTFDQSATYFRIGARRKDLAHIQSSDITALTGAIKTYATTDPTLSIAGAAADAKVVGDEINSLKDDLSLLQSGCQSFALLASWVNGGLSFTDSSHTSFTIDSSKQYRVTSLDVLSFNYNVTLQIASGYRAVLLTCSDGVYTDRGWKTGSVFIPKDTRFCIIIGKVTEDTSAVANINIFTSKVTIKAANDADIDDIKQKLDIIGKQTKNLLVPSQVINAYIGVNDYLAYTDTVCSVYIKCKPSTTYTVSKTAGTRFRIAYTKGVPTFSLPIYGRTVVDEASSLTLTTGNDAEYLFAWVYNATDSITWEEMLSSVQIEEGSSATPYTRPYTAIDSELRSVAIINNGDVLNNSDADTIIEDGYYIIGMSVTIANVPETSGRRMLFVLSGGANPAYKKQIFYNQTTGNLYGRDKVSGSWEAWNVIGSSTKDICGLFDGRIALSHGGIPTKVAYQNSPKAFKEARRIGIFYNDVDVTFTSDQVPIIVHDAELTPVGGSSSVVFRNITYEQLQQYSFGDSSYSWHLQTLKECYEYNAELGCKIGIDIGYLPSGCMAALKTYMKNYGIRPLYLVSSELTTFNQFVSNEMYDFPLGIVLSSGDTDEYITQKLTALLTMQNSQHLNKAWAFFRHEMIENEEAPYYSWVDDLLNAGISIEFYSFNTLSEIANATVPSYVSAWGGDTYNVNYERYKLIMSDSN